MLNSKYFRDDLVRRARSAHDKDGYIEGEEELTALARLDWEQAEPALKTHENGKQRRVSALATALAYDHYKIAGDEKRTEEDRKKLMAIAEDRDAPGKARDIACDALLGDEWEGEDEWYFSIMRDSSLRNLVDCI